MSLFLITTLLLTPASAIGKKGQKSYRQGLQYEAAQQWEKAAEEFSLAVAADPANSEYQLHYRRSVFNASQAFVQQGAALIERGDFVGAYNAFRRAYGYDPSNELARSMMERAFRLQTARGDAAGPEQAKPEQAKPAAPAARLTPTLYRPEADGPAAPRRPGTKQDGPPAPGRGEDLRAIQYSGDLQQFIKYLARQLRLNVVFDRDFPRRSVEVDLQDVTAAQAVDYVFLTQGLFFQKLSSRTILVAEQVKRPQYQQLVLRTFYLYNVDPNDARALITASIPPQAGRQPVITANKSTNSITVRDTPENVRLVGELLRSIDKERAEVVMDVNIYEVSRDDLMQLGNQVGTGDSLLNLGGIQKGLSVVGGSGQVVTQALSAIPTALGAAFIVPPTALSALQRKDNTRLVASTQVHAFDGEKSTAHIGQRVPVQTATVAPYGAVAGGEANNGQAGVAQGLFGGNGYPVIQYEKTGLTLEFTPQVFPDLDVQVKMSIKSNDVAQTAGAAALTPTFTERDIEGTARIQNNRTMMIASVAQNSQSRGRQGLPLLGLVPVLGRFVSSPSRNDRQTDIVIAVTPHVMRAPSVTPQDELMHPSGTLQTPTSDTLEALLDEADGEERLETARTVPTAPVQKATAENSDRAQASDRQASGESAKSSAATGQERFAAQDGTESTTFIPAPKALLETSNAPASDGTERRSVAAAFTAFPSGEVAAPARDVTLFTPGSAMPASPTSSPRYATATAIEDAPALGAGGSKPKAAGTEGQGATAGGPGFGGSLFGDARQTAPTDPVTLPTATIAADAEKSASASGARETEPADFKSRGGSYILRLTPSQQGMLVGEVRRFSLALNAYALAPNASVSLTFDPRVVSVRLARQSVTNPANSVTVGKPQTASGGLITIIINIQVPSAAAGPLILPLDIEALSPGECDVSLKLSAGGRLLAAQLSGARVEVKP